MTAPLIEKRNTEEVQVWEEKILSSIIRHGHELWRFAALVPEDKKQGRKKEVLPWYQLWAQPIAPLTFEQPHQSSSLEVQLSFVGWAKFPLWRKREYDSYILLNRIKKNWKYGPYSMYLWTTKGLAAHPSRKWKYQRSRFHFLEGLWSQLNGKHFLWIIKTHKSFVISLSPQLKNFFIKQHIN